MSYIPKINIYFYHIDYILSDISYYKSNYSRTVLTAPMKNFVSLPAMIELKYLCLNTVMVSPTAFRNSFNAWWWPLHFKFTRIMYKIMQRIFLKEGMPFLQDSSSKGWESVIIPHSCRSQYVYMFRYFYFMMAKPLNLRIPTVTWIPEVHGL